MTDGQDHRQSPVSATAILLTGLVLTLLAYLNTLTFGFVYDDHQMQGPAVLDLRAIAANFTHHMFAGIAQHGGYYRPVLVSWVTIVHFFLRDSTVAWHMAAIAMHLLVTWLVYLCVVELSRDRLLAALAAGIFGLHPVHVEVVAWISGAMSEGLLAALVMGSFYCYLRARNAQHRMAWLSSSWVLFAAALLVKETALALPLVIVVFEWLRTDEPARPSPQPRRLVGVMLPQIAIAAVYVVVRHLVLRSAAGPASSAAVSAVGSPWMTIPLAAWFYLRELAWPSRLSLFQPVLRIQAITVSDFWLPLLGALIGAGLLVAIARRSRMASFGVCFLTAMLLIPLAAVYALPKYEIVHDRYLYLPSVGVAILIALGLRKLTARIAQPGAILLVVGAVTAIVTVSQTNWWANDLVLYRRAVAVAPNSAMPYNLLANEMYKRGDAQAALGLYRHALDLDPRYWQTNFVTGITEYELGSFADAEKHLETASEIDPANPAEFALLADARMRLGNYAGAEEALRRGIGASPSAAQLRYVLGLALMRQGKLDEAQQSFTDEVRLHSDWSVAAAQRANEARILARDGGWQAWRPGPNYP